MAKQQKKKLHELKNIDGKIRAEEEQDNPQYEITSLDQLWHGDAVGFSKYQTMDLDEYQTQLTEMNSAELRKHAVEVAHVVPAISRERLEKRLVLEFQKHVNGYRIPKVSQKKDKEPSKAALRIMAEVK